MKLSTVANQSQWLISLDDISDWRTPTQAENKSKVSLQWQSSSISAHPLFMAAKPSVMGLDTLGTEMTEVSSFYETSYAINDPVTYAADSPIPMSQWLASRSTISDWLTNFQTELKNKVTLQQQVFSAGAHPLFMAVHTSVVGLNTVGQEMSLHSRFWEKDRWELAAQTGADRDYNMENLWDMLATEEGRPICTEDTGEPLGVTVGGGVAGQVVHHELVRGGWR